MKNSTTCGGLSGLALGLITVVAVATPVPLDTNDPQNGITEIYSATFDGALSPCTAPGAPSYCSFFGGFPPLSPPAVRNLTINPEDPNAEPPLVSRPSGIINGIPLGMGAPLPAGSFLDLDLDPGHTQVTLNGGVVRFPDPITIVIGTAGVPNTFINATGAGIWFHLPPAPATSIQTAPLDANGVAEFLVDLAPAVAVEFSLFSVVATDCTGTYCGLIPFLTLNMIKYRLVIDYDPTFTTFTASYVGKTANNSMLTGQFVSKLPSNVVVTDSVSPDADLAVPFGNVPVGQTRAETVTVANDGLAPLVIGQIAGDDPLADPFTVVSDTCSNQSVPPGNSCTFGIEFTPLAVNPSFTDTLDIPTDDVDNQIVTINVSGAGVSAAAPDITVTDSSSPFDDEFVQFRSVLVSEAGSQTITVTNDGPGDLTIGAIGQANPLAGAFAIVTDGCSGQILPTAGSCDIEVSFAPDAVLSYSDSLDIPSDDPDEGTVLIGVNGVGGAPVNVPLPDGAESGFMALDPLLLGLGAVAVSLRRRRSSPSASIAGN